MFPRELRAFALPLLAVALALFCPATAAAQTRPNFSGTWKQVQAAASTQYRHIEKIQQQDSSLKIVVETSSWGGPIGAGLYYDHTYTIGGKKEASTDNEGRVRTRSVKWEGNTLVFLTEEKEGKNLTTTREVWTLSEDGKALTKTRHTISWRGPLQETSVFEKQ